MKESYYVPVKLILM